MVLQIQSSFEKLNHISKKGSIFSIDFLIPKFPVNCLSRQAFMLLWYYFPHFITFFNFTAVTSKCNDLIAIKQSIVIKKSFHIMKVFKEAKKAKRKSFLGA